MEERIVKGVRFTRPSPDQPWQFDNAPPEQLPFSDTTLDAIELELDHAQSKAMLRLHFAYAIRHSMRRELIAKGLIDARTHKLTKLGQLWLDLRHNSDVKAEVNRCHTFT